jgi:signal transduction histidine kinase
LQGHNARRNALLALVASVAVGLVLISLEFSSSARKQILDIASTDARSKAEIQVHDLSVALANKVESVSSNLQVMSDATGIEEQNVERTVPLFAGARESTRDFVSSYFWVDAEGKLLWADAFVNETIKQQYIGGDRSHREYYIQPRETLMPYYSTVIESVDLVPRLYIAQPIVEEQDSTFKGALVASIDIDSIGKYAEGQLAPGYTGSTGLLDRNGIVLYSSNSPQFTGKNIFDPEIQAALPQEMRDQFNRFITDALGGQTGSADFTSQGSTSTIAYNPVAIRGNEFAILFVTVPHELAEDTVALVGQLQVLHTFIVVAIGTVAAGTIVLVLIWNRRLTRVVDSKTAELKSGNELLVESNRQLQTAVASLADVNDQLLQANEQLKQNDKMQNEFINVAAHELRTPVQPVLGIVEELEEKLEQGASEVTLARPEVEMLARNANRLVRLTSDILEVSRIEARALKLKKEPVELVNKISGVVADAKSFIEKGKDVGIVFEPRPIDRFVVEADRDKLFRVLSNLIKNAIKFTEKGVVEVSLEKEGDYAKISVRDTGRGIDPEMMPRLFAKFATSSDEGTGLGLFISKSIVEAHGGRIWAQNNHDGVGATFTFTLPIEKDMEIKS